MAQKQLTPEQQKILQERISKMSPEQIQKLIQQQCLFCKIVRGELPAHVVYEDSHTLAFLDINPAAPGHVLVVPKRHYAVLAQMPDQEVAEYFTTIKKLTSAVFEAVGAERVQVLQLGIEVPHVNFHLIPRTMGDGLDALSRPYNPLKLNDMEFQQIRKAIIERVKLQPAKSKIKSTTTNKTKKSKKKPLGYQPRLP